MHRTVTRPVASTVASAASVVKGTLAPSQTCPGHASICFFRSIGCRLPFWLREFVSPTSRFSPPQDMSSAGVSRLVASTAAALTALGVANLASLRYRLRWVSRGAATEPNDGCWVLTELGGASASVARGEVRLLAAADGFTNAQTWTPVVCAAVAGDYVLGLPYREEEDREPTTIAATTDAEASATADSTATAEDASSGGNQQGPSLPHPALEQPPPDEFCVPEYKALPIVAPLFDAGVSSGPPMLGRVAAADCQFQGGLREVPVARVWPLPVARCAASVPAAAVGWDDRRVGNAPLAVRRYL